MRIATTVAAFGLLVGASAQLGRKSEETVGEFNGYIIEYAKGGANFRGSPSLESEDVKVVRSFESEIFSGAAVETTDHTEDDLLALPQVARVWRNRVVYLEPSNDTQTFSDDANTANYTSHHLTKVSTLHESGIKGKGAKVAIIDTGIQYTHPALGGGIGDGFKIAGGYDFVGDGLWPDSGEITPDDDPMDQQGHGTHVAGIVAGLSDRFSGVAPEATLYAYKVFSRSGGTTESILIEAFLKAFEDGVDIISASIGGTNGWEDNAWAVVASRLVDQGIVVTISAGNSGDAGPFYGSSGSSGKGVIAVASTANLLAPAPSFRVNFDQHCRRNTSIVGYIPTVLYFSEDIVDWPILPVSLNTSAEADACEPFAEGEFDFTDTVALVRRGGCPVTTKQRNLAAAGAYWILLYNNEQPLSTFEPENYQTMLSVIEDFSGEAMVKAIAAGAKVTVDFSATDDEIVALPWAYGGRASYFTTWGGLNELQLKPDIAAPGGEIFSTFPNDLWATKSGTSMSAPYVAGVAALYIGLNGGRSVHGVGSARALSQRIISSGNNVKAWEFEDEHNAPPPQVGTGLIDAVKVIGYTTTIDFDAFALNDTANFVPIHNLTLRNGGDEAVTYEFLVEAADGFDVLFQEDDGTAMWPRIKTLYDLEPVAMPVDVDLPASLTLGPGESELVSFNFHKPTFEGYTLPMYSGKILIKSSNNETLSVPFLGLAADLKEEMSDMFMDNMPEAIKILGWQSIYDNASWSNEVWRDQDWLYTTVQLKWATRELRWDIYEAGWNDSAWSYPPTLGDDGYVGSVAYWRQSATRWWSPFSFDADPTDSEPFPLYDLNRNAVWGQYRNTFQWFGMLANGSQLEPGNYKMRLAALKPFGDPKLSEDWSIWNAPEISILGKFGPNPWSPGK
ncbi:subtilase [Plectosphaerella plurivora]|uniref:Subtilase n=1 Tax=Plectosphaerella plurivora TaxID=936078 RepID=A0A9P8VA82_9PEZI|nr:subtilase [Plectosphaerella plurivora]